MTRKLVLKDVDGVVLVVDSQPAMLKANLDSLKNLYDTSTSRVWIRTPSDRAPLQQA